MYKFSLNNTQKAFIHKTDNQLKNSHLIFKLMSYPALISFLKTITIISLKLNLPVKLLIKLSVFRQFCGGESIDECEAVYTNLNKRNIGSILDYSIEGKENEEDFNATKNEIIKIINIAKNKSEIPFTCLKITGIIKHKLLEKVSSNIELNAQEKLEYRKSVNRLTDICFNAYCNKVPIYIDAEESWIQTAIDDLAEKMMLEYNKEMPIVLTTLQMYRWNRIAYLENLIEKSKKNNFFLGIKLVRGAYWEKENERAQLMRYQSPVHSQKDATDKDFDTAIELCLKNIDKILLCAGTHNETSTLFVVNKMKELGLRNNHPHIFFSQLYGMSDHISYNLAEAGYNVTKYLPYGPIRSVIPYLIRRAEENTSIEGQMGRELSLLNQEIERRKKVFD